MIPRYEAGEFLRRDLRLKADYFANHSLNRTRYGMRLKARQFILGIGPHTATGRLTQKLSDGFSGSSFA